ncbi:MAG: hypothetical protein ACD_75C00236G0001 [uncultured bacterium]|nr:MAG: hypothetical protein ACD_75C00236G0001 [uncultured bacterium]
MRGALLSLGVKDLNDLLEKEGDAEVRCEFCRQTYRFGGAELAQLIETGKDRRNTEPTDV